MKLLFMRVEWSGLGGWLGQVVGLDGPLAGKLKIKLHSVQLGWKLTEIGIFSFEWWNVRNKLFIVKLNESFK